MRTATATAAGGSRGTFPWFLAGTTIGSLLLAGILAGYLSGVRGAGAGLLNGMTAWGLLFVVSVVTVVPGITAITTSLGTGLGAGQNPVGGAIGQSGGAFTAENAVWTTFWSLVIGAVVAGGGGVLGAAMKRDPKVADADVHGRQESEPYPADGSSVRLGTESHGAGPVLETDTRASRR